MFCDKVGGFIFKSLYFVGRFLGLVAFEYDFEAKLFATTAQATVISTVISILIAIASPFVVKWNTEIYYVEEIDEDDNFTLITGAQFAFGFAASFVVLLCFLRRRETVSCCANDFRRICSQLKERFFCTSIMTPEIILLIAMKLSITMYEILINIPFFIEHADKISPHQFASFLLNLYIAEIAAVFSDITFATMLLLSRYFSLMNAQLESLRMAADTDTLTAKEYFRRNKSRLRRLIRMYMRVRRMVEDFGRCVEVPVLVQTLNSFTNMLTNLFALLHFYALENSFELKAVLYNVMIFINIYLLIYAADRVRHASADVRDTLLDMGTSDYIKRPEWRNEDLVFKIWPMVCEIDILGMFPLNNSFVLFLITYATSFVVIILEFQLTKLLSMKYMT